jgi:hypothetical protein
MQIKNKTGRTIALYINEEWVTFHPDGDAAVLNEEHKTIGIVNGINLQAQLVKGIDNLPPQEPNTLIVVDKEVAMYSWRQYRDDVVYMHKPLIKDDKHNSLASLTLMTWCNVSISYCL